MSLVRICENCIMCFGRLGEALCQRLGPDGRVLVVDTLEGDAGCAQEVAIC